MAKRDKCFPNYMPITLASCMANVVHYNYNHTSLVSQMMQTSSIVDSSCYFKIVCD